MNSAATFITHPENGRITAMLMGVMSQGLAVGGPRPAAPLRFAAAYHIRSTVCMADLSVRAAGHDGACPVTAWPVATLPRTERADDGQDRPPAGRWMLPNSCNTPAGRQLRSRYSG